MSIFVLQRMNTDDLALPELVEILDKFADDYCFLTRRMPSQFPTELNYSCSRDSSDDLIESLAKTASLKKFGSNFVKTAFDTRKANLQTDRNPRENLQFYNRSASYITEDEQKKIELFEKVKKALDEIEKNYEGQKEYLVSYSRVLLEALDNLLKEKDGHLDVFAPKFEYISQILYLRYRLTLDEIEKLDIPTLKTRILEKDEDLLKRGIKKENKEQPNQIVKAKDNLLESLFGTANLRQNGEKTVERTITITIKDSIIE